MLSHSSTRGGAEEAKHNSALLREDTYLPPERTLMFILQGNAYAVLPDSGARITCIDAGLAHSLGLKIDPPSSAVANLQMAHGGVTVPRHGTVVLRVEVLFPMTDRKPLLLDCRFEVLPLRKEDSAQSEHSDYHFLIGTDTIRLIFPRGLPREYMPAPSLANGVPTISVLSLRDAAPIAPLDVDDAEVDRELGIPEDQRRAHATSACTPAELEQEYAPRRAAMMDRLRPLLDANQQVKGPCNVPESVVVLKVDESKVNTVFIKQYPIAERLRAAITENVQRWLDNGIIARALPGCRFNNPLLGVPKKDEHGNYVKVRTCEDVRNLNKMLISGDNFPLPVIRDLLESLGAGGNVIFGKLDCNEAYTQLFVHPDSQQYTAFTWAGQQYVFVGCPYGISMLTSHFQRLMATIFHDMPFVVPYVDDIIFASRSWEEHELHARLIIERLTSCNLRLKPSYHMGHAELHVLGHVISTRGTSIDPKKAQAIEDWSLPTTPSELGSFLGLCSFVRQHIRHYAELTGPLEVAKHQKALEWTDNLREHFFALKEALRRAPILCYPDFPKPFHIATDASNTGVGGVLFQPSSPGEHITATNMVALYSKKLNDTQRRWSAYKKELYGVVLALRKFHCYVWGRDDLVVHTDHKPLTFMFTSTQLSPPLQQWLDTLMDYTFEIVHRDGILNFLPDQLSRLYGTAYTHAPVWGAANLSSHFATPLTDEVTIRALSLGGGRGGSSSAPARPSVTASVATHNDEGRSDDSDDDDARADTATTEDESAADAEAFASLQVELERRGKQCPATAEERLALIQKEHLFGHFGREAVFNQLWKKGFWWPSIRDEISNELRNCDACTRFTVVKKGFHPAQCITSSGPGEHFQIDTSIHLPESPDGFVVLLVLIDIFTGFILLQALKDHTAETVARALWSMFCIIGFPKILQSDNGPEFTNDVLRALARITGTEHRFITPYNPRADGKVERSIGSCMSIIKKMLYGTNTHWPMFVSFAQVSFNNKISALTGSSPFALMFGRELNEVKDYSTEDAPTLISLDDWKQHQEKIISLIYPAISSRIKSGKDKLLQRLDRHRRILLPNSFPEGSTVMLEDPVRQNKFEPKYVGPYTIVRRTRHGAYILKDATGDLLDRPVTADKLKLIAKIKRRKKDEDQPVFEVNKILNHRGSPGNYEYLVDWTGYTEEERTWEHQSNFMDTKCIEKYWKGLQ